MPSQSLGTAVFIIVVIHPAGLVKFLLVGGVDGRHSLGDRFHFHHLSRVVLNCFYQNVPSPLAESTKAERGLPVSLRGGV